MTAERFQGLILGLMIAWGMACAGMPDTKVIGEDFSQYQIECHPIPANEVAGVCGPKVWGRNWFLRGPVLGQTILACAELNFDRKTCDIFIWSCELATGKGPDGKPMPNDLLSHELLHCQGYDHGTSLQRALDAWKAQR